ncbi:MAG: TSUP family transporter [Sporichthyaceae bacterium]
MPELTVASWGLLVVAAVAVGFAKTGISGVGSVASALFAVVLPARESTGALLPLLIAGDLVAIALYTRHTQWSLIRRLFPWVAAGIVAGAVFVAHVGNGGMRTAIGLLLLGLVGIQLLTQSSRLRAVLGDPGDGPAAASHRVAAAVVGVVAGFVTMVANASGPVMSVYLLLSGFSMLRFLGTGAWFFFLVNVFKLPFSIGLGLVSPSALLADAALLPAMALGAALGALLVRRIAQGTFERVTLVLVVVSAVPLLL